MMLTLMAYGMIAVFMTAIMTNRLSALIALILVPILFGVLAGFGPELPKMAVEGLRKIAPTAVLLLFAILYFGLMIDVGLFDPLVRLVVTICKGDPMRVIVGSTLLAMIISLDGDGSTTYMLCITAMLPLHRKLGINPLILPAVTMLPNSIMNIAPWGGPTARVMASLHLDAVQVFTPLIPAIALASLGTIGIAYFFGVSERRRLGMLSFEGKVQGDAIVETDDYDDDPVPIERAVIKPSVARQIFNGALTMALMVLLVLDVMPLAMLFMIAFCIAITVNFPGIKEQRRIVEAHAPNALAVVSVIFGAGVFTGVLSGTGMTDALASSIVYMIPPEAGNLLPLITAVISAPFTFFLSNDAFYFGVVPVLAEAAAKYGIAPEVIARASLIGQPVHQLSPLVAATYVLVGLSGVEFGAHQRFSILWACLLALLMLVGAVVFGAVPLF